MISDILSKVLTAYKADTTDHVKGLEKLKGAERERVQATIDAGKQAEASYESQLKALGRMAAGVASAIAIGKGALDSFSDYAEHSKLEAAAAGVSVDKLAAATKGLKTDTELLADAARLNHGAIKLNTDQMAIAERAMIQYTRQGHENAKAHDAVLQAVTALKVDGLKDLGVFVDTAGLSMEKEADRGEILKRVFAELTTASAEFANQSLSDAERIEVSANKIGNAIDRLKRNVGKGLTAGVEQVEEVSKPGNLASAILGLGNTDLEDISDTIDARRSFQDLLDLRDEQVRAAVDSMLAKGAVDRSAGRPEIEMPSENMRRPTGGGGTRAPDKQLVDVWAKELNQTIDSFIAGYVEDFVAEVERQELQDQAQVKSYGFDVKADGERFNKLFEQANKSLAGIEEAGTREDRYSAFAGKQSASKLEAVFGPIEEFNAYKTAFDTLSGSVGAALGAWIDGSESAGHAFKRFLGEAVKGIAIQMAMEAVKHGAYAIGSLAFGDVAGAAMHAKAAVAFGAGAALAAVAAKELHVGGAPAGGAGGRAGAPPIGGAGGGGGGRASASQPVIMIVGDPMDTEINGRRRQDNAERIVRNVLGDSSGGNF